MRICTVQEMREMDRRAVEEYGLPEAILMENAGQAVYNVVKSQYGTGGRRYVVICGRGNNGGDGLVLARLLHSNGADVKVFLLADETSVSGAAEVNFDAARKAGVPLQRLCTVEDLYLGRRCDVVIDALFGTGITREVAGLEADVIGKVNESGLPVVSVDIPSGVDGDTGAVHGVGIRAACTVTFGSPKWGNVLPPGREMCGQLFLSRISFPPALQEEDGLAVLNRLTRLPDRPAESHKSDYGDVLFVAGAGTYLGAPALSVLSFLRAGGGYARLATPRSIAPLLATSASEVVLIPLAETVEGTIAVSNLDELRQRGAAADAVVVGPGLSLNEETQELVRALVAVLQAPVVIDGDGLTAIADHPAALTSREAPTCLTPHAGEMSRLLGWSVEQVVAHRVEAVREAAVRFDATVLLKGSSTLVCGPDGVVSVNLSGNPGMATAGCGDVLAGTIAALLGVGLAPREATETGAFIHGFAGDLAAWHKGQDGVIARDVMESLPEAVRLYREGFSEIRRNFYGCVVVI
ncbi:MAG: NAD(P)H-hydrate dehydratase [Chloroflexota bacterium]